MRNKVMPALLLPAMVLVLLLAGCTTFKAEGLSFMPPDDGLQVVGTFEEKVTVHKFLGNPGGLNLFNITSNATVNALTGEVWNAVHKAGGTGAVDVKVKYSANVLHYLANSITFGIWAPAKITVSGTIVRKSGASLTRTDAAKLVETALADAAAE